MRQIGLGEVWKWMKIQQQSRTKLPAKIKCWLFYINNEKELFKKRRCQVFYYFQVPRWSEHYFLRRHWKAILVFHRARYHTPYSPKQSLSRFHLCSPEFWLSFHVPNWSSRRSNELQILNLCGVGPPYCLQRSYSRSCPSFRVVSLCLEVVYQLSV